MANLPFQLEEGEKIIDEVIPNKRGFLLQRVMGGMFGSLFIGVFMLIWVVGFVNGLTSNLALSIALAVVVAFVTFITPLIMPFLAYDKFKYWVTNQRVVGSRGVISYDIESVSVDSINDVVLTRTVSDRILGLSSLTITVVGGYLNPHLRVGAYGQMAGTANFFPALTPDRAAEVQKEIFDARNAIKKK